jgi:hypothetical protein
MAVGEAAAVVTTLKNAWELVDKLRKTDDKETLRNGVAQLTEMLFDARATALALVEEKATLIDRVQALERNLRDAVDFSDQSEKFKRVKTRGGIFVYREHEASDRDYDAPYFCPTCFGNKKASILVGRPEDTFHHCHVCKWGNYL